MASGQNQQNEAVEVSLDTVRDKVEDITLDKTNSSCNENIVIFDLETTGLIQGKDIPDICQIAAMAVGSDMWSRYLIPDKDVNPDASRITGLKVIRNDGGQRVLTKGGNEIKDALEYKAGLKAFYDYLCQLSQVGTRIILIAHYGMKFDFQVLINAFKKINVDKDRLDGIGVWYADSHTLLRALHYRSPHVFPMGNRAEISFKLTALYQQFFQQDFPAHDACEDVRALKRLLFDSTIATHVESLISKNVSQTLIQ